MTLILSTIIIIVVVPVMLGASGVFLLSVYLYRKRRNSMTQYPNLKKLRTRVTSMDSDLESLVDPFEKRVTIQPAPRPPPLASPPSAHLRPKRLDVSRRKTLSTGPRARLTLADKMLEVQTLMWEIRKLQLLRKDEHEYQERIEELNERLMVVIETGESRRTSTSTINSVLSPKTVRTGRPVSRAPLLLPIYERYSEAE